MGLSCICILPSGIKAGKMKWGYIYFQQVILVINDLNPPHNTKYT